MSTENANTNDIPMGQGTTDDGPQFSRSACQLGIFVLDGSGSMEELDINKNPKHQSVNEAIKEVIQRLSASNRAIDFDVCIIKFGQEAELVSDITPVLKLDPMGNYDPLIGGNTYIKKALIVAEQKALGYLKNPPSPGVSTSVVLVVLTDGIFSEDPTEVVDRLKKNETILINACFFGESPNNQAISGLKKICTDPVNGYLTTYNTQQVRDFFLKSATSGKKI